MHQNRQNLLVNCHIERFLTFFPVTTLLNILCIFHAFFRISPKVVFITPRLPSYMCLFRACMIEVFHMLNGMFEIKKEYF